MANVLSTKEWRSLLDQKVHKSIKKTGVSETLDDYKSATDKDDLGKMTLALERIVEKAGEVKKKYAEFPGLVEYLGKMITAAEKDKASIRQRLKEMAQAQEEQDDQDNSLAAVLKRAHALDDENAWYFVLAPGKPASGLVITKKEPKKSDIEKAIEMRGKKGPFAMGRIYGEGANYILETEAMPVKGWAKAAMGAALMHAKLRIKVIMRGGGVSLDSDNDIDMMAEGSGTLAPELQGDGDHGTNFKGRVDQLRADILLFAKSPGRFEAGAESGLMGSLGLLGKMVDGSSHLSEDEKEKLRVDIGVLRLQLDEAVKPPKHDYIELSGWQKAAEQVLKLDPGKQAVAWQRYAGLVKAVALKLSQDQTLTPFQRKHITEVLAQAAKLIKGHSLESRVEQSRTDVQLQVYKNLVQSAEFLRKAAVPSNLLKDPVAMRDLALKSPELRELLQSMSTAVKQPGMESGKTLESASRKLLQSLKPPKHDDVPGQENGQEKAQQTPEQKDMMRELAAELLKRSEMMQIGAEFGNLGAPPWPEDKNELALELQARLFFIEGAVTQGKPHYEAPGLGREGGASGSWWIERMEPSIDKKEEGPSTMHVDGKRKYIFKPAQLEGAVMPGMPPGSGAPREVLAKRLDDSLRGVGIEVGVSPTSLVSIDSSQLGNVNPGDGPLLGSMQQLTPSQGSLGEKMRTLGEFSQNIDKKSFDDVAIFDMIYANVDRHGGNMLFDTDANTGRVKLLPIDHGACLPDPDVLQLNGASLTETHNVLANDDMAPAQQPLGPESLLALARLDPDQVMTRMRDARNDLAQRHPSTADRVSDKAILAMGARIRFIKHAAGQVPVNVLFKMLARGAKRIAEVQPDGVPALFETLQRELGDVAQVKQELGDVGRSLVRNDMPNDIVAALASLGWMVSEDKAAINRWMTGNPKLIQRILKTGMANRAFWKNYDDLLEKARLKDPTIDTAVARQASVSDKYKLLWKTVNADLDRAPSGDLSVDSLKQLAEGLGGVRVLDQAALVFPLAGSSVLPVDEADSAKKWADRVLLLRQWQRFEALGGVARWLELMPGMDRDLQPDFAIRSLEQMVQAREQVVELSNLEEGAVGERALEGYGRRRQEVQDLVGGLLSEQARQRFTPGLERCDSLQHDGKALEVTFELARLLNEVRSGLASDKRLLGSCARVRKEIDEALQDESVRIGMAGQMDRILGLIQTTEETGNDAGRSRAEREFKARAEQIRLGDESGLVKFTKACEALTSRIDLHAGLPYHDELMRGLQNMRTKLDEFDTDIQSQVNNATHTLDRVDMLLAALKEVGADVDNLPQAVAPVLQPWPERVRNSSLLDKAAEDADTIRKLMAPN